MELIRPVSLSSYCRAGATKLDAQRETNAVINVPENDKFQVITEHAPEELNVAESYMGNRYSNDVVLIQITLSSGRPIDLKKAFYKRIVDDLHDQLKMRREDVVINLVEVAKENWSFGGGIAQYVT